MIASPASASAAPTEVASPPRTLRAELYGGPAANGYGWNAPLFGAQIVLRFAPPLQGGALAEYTVGPGLGSGISTLAGGIGAITRMASAVALDALLVIGVHGHHSIGSVDLFRGRGVSASLPFVGARVGLGYVPKDSGPTACVVVFGDSDLERREIAYRYAKDGTSGRRTLGTIQGGIAFRLGFTIDL